MKAYRYPGVTPFQPSQQEIFFGRENDIERLSELTNLESIVVIYSKSGIGKSSLINAGLIPKLTKESPLQVVPIRFGAYTEGRDETLTHIFAQIFTNKFNLQPSDTLDKISPVENSIWYLCKQLQISQQPTFQGLTLVFDQFEEIFTYPDSEIIQFKRQLAEVLHSEIPERFRKIIEHQYRHNQNILSDEELDILHQPIEIRVIIAIRSDRLSLLNNLSDEIPNIFKVCYQLDALSMEAAEEAIINPAFMRSNRFISAPFDYEDEALEKILLFLTNNRKDLIDSSQLQILCQYIEQQVIENNLTRVELPILSNLQHIFETYYERQINQLSSEEEKISARKLIEEGLIFEEEEMRISLYEGQIYKHYGFTPALLQKLVDVRLIRAEPSLRGGYSYELNHDTLVAPILKAKKARLEIERIAADEKRNQEWEAQLKTLEEQANTEKRKRRQAVIIATGAVLLAIAAILSGMVAYRQTLLAKAFSKQISLEKAKTEKLNTQLYNNLKEIAESQYNQLIEQGRRYSMEENFDQAIAKFNAAIRIAELTDIELDSNAMQARKAIADVAVLKESLSTYNRLISEGQVFEQRASQNIMNLLKAAAKYREAAQLLDQKEYQQQAYNYIKAIEITIEKEFFRIKERALIYDNMGNKSEACKLFRQANQLLPGNKEVLQYIAKCN